MITRGLWKRLKTETRLSSRRGRRRDHPRGRGRGEEQEARAGPPRQGAGDKVEGSQIG